MTKRNMLQGGVVVLSICLGVALLVRGQEKHSPGVDGSTKSHDCPMMAEMNERGDKAMGFDHAKTTHHFLMARDGGAIQVEANSGTDLESREQIRRHLKHIAMMFSEGNFETPMLVHAKTPSGTEVMQRLKAEISYKYEETERGALIRISTRNADALQAVYEFLRFQIKEHMTGDRLEVV